MKAMNDPKKFKETKVLFYLNKTRSRALMLHDLRFHHSKAFRTFIWFYTGCYDWPIIKNPYDGNSI